MSHTMTAGDKYQLPTTRKHKENKWKTFMKATEMDKYHEKPGFNEDKQVN